MKKTFLLISILASFFSCSDDDDSSTADNDTVVTPSVVRITEVDSQADLVELSNLGGETIDVADYWLCLGPGTYVRVSDATDGSTVIASNESVTLSYDVNEEADGLSVFSTDTFGSSDPTILVDYVQWGAANQARVDQAVTAGRWDDESNFVVVAPVYTFTGESSDFGSVFW